tara:strand:+ start:349 stop:600 length:252 start_codon:yes stop_codon:yes gene_type:complete
MKSKKYVLKEGMFNWLLNMLVGKSTNAKLRYYVAIKTDPKLRKLSREFEKAARGLQTQWEKSEKDPHYDKAHHDNLKNILQGK